MVTLTLALLLLAPTTTPAITAPPATAPAVAIRPRGAELLHADDFAKARANWSVESERGGTVAARDGKLVIDVPAGCTVWFRPKLDSPVLIEYQATMIAASGVNDRVSDLNCFFMASDARSPDDLFATRRAGKFEEYNPLRCYYVGVGGNDNTTTRFRRYIGDAQLRPLLPEHDLREPAALLTPNKSQTIRIIARGKSVQFWRDDVRLFEMTDPEPYTTGHFAFRTVRSHIEIRRFRVYRLPAEPQENRP